MSRKRRPRKGLRTAGTRWSSMSNPLKGFTIVVKKIQENLSNLKSTDQESKKDSLAEFHASKNRSSLNIKPFRNFTQEALNYE